MRKPRGRGLRSVTTSNHESRTLNQFWWLQNPTAFHNNEAAQQKMDAKGSDNMRPSKTSSSGPSVPPLPTVMPVGLARHLNASVFLTQEKPSAPGLSPTFLSHLSGNVRHSKGNQERKNRYKASVVLK